MKIVIFIDWFYPAFKAGGPIKSVFNIIQSLKSEHDFLVISSNEDLNGEHIEVACNQIISKDGYQIIYLDSSQRSKSKYLDLASSYGAEIIYLNSIFSYAFAILPILAFAKKKDYTCIIAPRGMLSKGALSLKPLKKKLFLAFLRNSNLLKRVHWHASSALEENEIKESLNIEKQIHIAQNIASPISENLKPIKKERGEVKFCFISRISEKKNLLFFLNLIQNQSINSKLNLDIYGPIDELEYWESCTQIDGFGLNIRYLGTLNPLEISSTLEKYHFFVLPSLNENYGHVIAEAINNGRPVLISDQTPWLNLEKEGVGFSISLNNENEWIQTIHRIADMNDEEYNPYLENCVNFSKAKIVSEEVIQQNLKLFGAHES